MGLEALDHMMDHHTFPIIMVGALTAEGAGVTLQALARGAVDFIEFEIVNWYWGRLLRRAK
jgi:two-component system chemotaxis response regulator CheB